MISWESQTVTADVQPRGKYETVKTSTPLLAEYSERSQSKETPRNVNSCQRRSDQRRQRNGSQFAEKESTHQTQDIRQVETT